MAEVCTLDWHIAPFRADRWLDGKAGADATAIATAPIRSALSSHCAMRET